MRSPTVLVVDDDPDLRTILQSVLVSEGLSGQHRRRR